MLVRNRQNGPRMLNACLQGGIKFAHLLKDHERGKYPFKVEVLEGRATLNDHDSLYAGMRHVNEGDIIKAREQLERHFSEAEVVAILEGRAKIVAHEIVMVTAKKSETRSRKKSPQMAAAA